MRATTAKSAIRSPPPRAALWRAKDGGEGRIRTFEATGATDLQSVAFDRFATSPIPVRHTHAGRRAGMLGTLSIPLESNSVCRVFCVCPRYKCRPRLVFCPGWVCRNRGAGEGIRTPDRLITNQLLYRTELRQPRQNDICSTCRATSASAARAAPEPCGQVSIHQSFTSEGSGELSRPLCQPAAAAALPRTTSRLPRPRRSGCRPIPPWV